MSYAPYSCNASHNEEIAEELIQKISGTLSVIGSSYIIVDVIRRLRSEKADADPYQKIMLGLSFFDIITSFFDNVLGTWMTPVETGWWGAAGNQATCTAQGFFTAFGFIGGYGYQMALSLNLLFLIAFGWSQKNFAQKIEQPMHCIIISAALLYALVPLFYESYNPSCGQCLWDVRYEDCSDSISGDMCVARGSEAIRDRYWDVFWACMILMLCSCTIAMVWVYCSVRSQERKMKKYRYDENHNRESKRIRKILLLYTIALYLCLGVPFSIIFGTLKAGLGWPTDIPFGVRCYVEIFIPLQGFFNFLVYFQPKCLKYQRENPGTWLIMAYFHVLMPCSRCCSFGEKEETKDTDMGFSMYNATSSGKTKTSDQHIEKDIEELDNSQLHEEVVVEIILEENVRQEYQLE